MPKSHLYTSFEIPKKSGGVRQISAPIDQLKGLQRHLANILYSCVTAIEAETGKLPLSHGFRHNRSIITNAAVHKRHRYVLNLDLEDFFPSINFGRVRGFFIKSRGWNLDPNIATLIAQIACHENELPQGSPCSPIIADLIAGILDARIIRLAKKFKVSYSRYVDDLTFSTNNKAFPSGLASQSPACSDPWVLGTTLVSVVTRSGFSINTSKTRMQCRPSRQEVTGLTVNAKVNIHADYYRRVRAQCLAVFATGVFWDDGEPDVDEDGKVSIPVEAGKLSRLEGRMSHIHHVKDQIDRRSEVEKKKTPTSFRKLYAKFLFQKYFLTAPKPILVCEGKTDNVYLSLAIKHLSDFHPKLGIKSAQGFERNISFFPLMGQSRKLIEIGNGAGDLKFFILRYKENLNKFLHHPTPCPVIVMIDNDDGAKDIFSIIKEKYGLTINLNSSDSFFHISDNLYLVKTPKMAGKQKSCIEDSFEPDLLKVKLDGKTFNLKKAHNSSTEYGKQYFAERVVRPKAAKLNWSGFKPILKSISDVMDDHAAKAGK